MKSAKRLFHAAEAATDPELDRWPGNELSMAQHFAAQVGADWPLNSIQSERAGRVSTRIDASLARVHFRPWMREDVGMLAWLEDRQRLYLVVRMTLLVVGHVFSAAIVTIFYALVGVMVSLGLVCIWWMVMGGALVDVEIDPKILQRIAWLSAALGGFLALTVMVARFFRSMDKNSDTRSRVVRARGVVAQAIVAHGLRHDVHRLDLGLTGGSNITYSTGRSVIRSMWIGDLKTDAREAALFDELAVLLADPSLAGRDWNSKIHRSRHLKRVGELVDEIQLCQALAAASMAPTVSLLLEDRGDILAAAVRTGREHLDLVPEHVRHSLGRELVRAGTMRGGRFRMLLKHSEVPQSAEPTPAD